MTLRMYDAVTVVDLPAGADAYAGYVDGRYANIGAIRARFPATRTLAIAVRATTTDADALDVENGDATPDQVPGWVAARHALGDPRPVVYASVSAIAEIMTQLSSHDIVRAQVRLWSAHYTTRHICNPGCYPTMPVTADGTQWIDHGGYDESVLSDNFFSGGPTPGSPSGGSEVSHYAVVCPVGQAVSVPVPPPHGGAVPVGDVYVSLGADFATHARVAIFHATGPEVLAPDPLPVPNGRTWVRRLVDGDQSLTVENLGPGPLSVLVEVGAP